MSKDIRFKKGANLNLIGKAEKSINNKSKSDLFALQPNDFFSLTPKLLVREGDLVSKGSAVFHDKNNISINFVSPVSGVVDKIIRGPKRRIESVIIKKEGERVLNHILPKKLNRDIIVKFLTKSGCWPFIKQRPYNVIANPNDTPKSILVSCFTSAPLDVDFDFFLAKNKDDFQSGINILNQLIEGKVILTIDHTPNSFFKKINNVEIIKVNGPHPSSNPSFQIQKISPINMGDKVWVIRPQDVVNIGLFFNSGVYEAQRTIAIAGSCVKNPQYFQTTIGAQLEPIIKIAGLKSKIQSRFINGDVLTGTTTSINGFLGFYNNLVSIIPEGKKYRMFGWLPFIDNFIPSLSKTSLSWFFSKKEYEIDTNLNGEERALVVTGEMEKVFPMDVYPMQLLKVCMTGDIEKMEAFGIYEVVPEDFGLIDYSNTSKIEAQEIISDAIELMIKEVG